jgi:uncharacterized protein involved in type VI secretion and phage assembly
MVNGATHQHEYEHGGDKGFNIGGPQHQQRGARTKVKVTQARGREGKGRGDLRALAPSSGCASKWVSFS